MDKNSTGQLKVGAFIILGIILIATSIVALSGNSMWFSKTVKIYAHFENVQGLNVGSIVSLSGINIGNISNISFLESENKLSIEMQISFKHLSKITEGASAEIRTQGALGDKLVFIIPGQINGQPIKENSVIDVNKSTDLLGIISEKGSEAGKVFDIISELHKVLKTMNDQNRTERIMSNFAEASQSLKQSALESQKLISDFRSHNSNKLKKSIDHLDNILSKIDRGEGSLGALINDSTIHDQLKGMLGGSSRKNHIKSVIKTSIDQK